MISKFRKAQKTKLEKIDLSHEIEEKSKRLADLIANSKNFTCFTGAGLSTSTGIPDYRSTSQTIIKTGAGQYELPPETTDQQKIVFLNETRRQVQAAKPSLSHMALFALMQNGYLKHVISQNTDALHLKSGIPYSNLTELHGNTTIEYCKSCSKMYFRDFRCRVSEDPRNHITGRKCEDTTCDGDLADEIVHFGESIPKDKLVEALTVAQQSDLQLCMGTSLRVKPANQIPIQTLKNKGSIAIVNLQYTPFDEHAHIRIHSLTDQVLVSACSHLNIEIPEYSLKRRIHITRPPLNENSLSLYGTYGNHKNMKLSFMQRIEYFDSHKHIYLNLDKEPFHIPDDYLIMDSTIDDEVEFRIHFYGHNREPYYSLLLPRSSLKELKSQEHLVCDITFDYNKLEWI
ncbi:transcriptional sir2 family protein [Stylonychia lemnae]|uniref:Transcriptional sir2 family protein n=1 Tax=Stylonychia lemnae TaxID=5949 RepID=A0A078B8N2_STYLE|nr:transcriptional sir2 family protein [Stylonychia lemnae]|eukprot:CDW89667.1 transcriptional sir2 family protein [Stylonychia lemnae]